MTKSELLEFIGEEDKCYVSTAYTGCCRVTKEEIKESDMSVDYFYCQNTGSSIYCAHILYVSTKQINLYKTPSTTIGSDPEFFFVDKGGDVVPSMSVVDKTVTSTVISDGFQGELNPASSSCREVAASSIYNSLAFAKGMAEEHGHSISLEVGKVVGEKVWASTPTSMKRFGCNPTLNSYNENIRKVTGIRERFRSCGGHIHIGLTYKESEVQELVYLMDIVAGNTAVLIDRDINNVRRRLRYGRAGEYRLKTYGIEYRVFSNFWLRHYVLWSMCSALVRNAVQIHRSGYYNEVASLFNSNDIRKAINENDKELAMTNFLKLANWIKSKNLYSHFGLSVHNIDTFIDWASNENPIDKLKVDTFAKSYKSWSDKYHQGAKGFERFLEGYDNIK